MKDGRLINTRRTVPGRAEDTRRAECNEVWENVDDVSNGGVDDRCPDHRKGWIEKEEIHLSTEDTELDSARCPHSPQCPLCLSGFCKSANPFTSPPAGNIIPRQSQYTHLQRVLFRIILNKAIVSPFHITYLSGHSNSDTFGWLRRISHK